MARQSALFAALALAMVFLPPAAARGQGSSKPDEGAKSEAINNTGKTQTEVGQWIKQLDDDRFQVREAATVELIKSGREAVAPLAKAAVDGGLEVTVRAVHILSRLGASTDLPTAEAARLALEDLAEGREAAARERASAALEILDAQEADRALERLKTLGAYFGTGRIAGEGESVPYHLIVARKWSGGNDGIKLLRFIRDVNYVSIHGAKISDDAVSHLLKLKHLQRLELYGTDLSETAAEKVKTGLAGVDVDVRGGGLLGVQGQPDAPGCQITVVRPDQAAAKAGLEPGDIIVKCDDKEIDTFNKLLEYIRPKKAGTKVKVVVRRGEMTFEREVTLSAWGAEDPRPAEKKE
jgi:hypothetical protein